MNVIEAAQAAGMLPERDETFGKVYEVEEQQLERFAKIIRNQALEDAAKCCESIFDKDDDSCNEAEICAKTIRSMKKDQTNG